MNSTRAAAAGLIGTAVMTTLLLIEPSVGLPQIAMGQILSTSMGSTAAHLPNGPAVGWLIHFVMGIVLALVYAKYVVRVLPGNALARGALFGVLVFLIAQVTFMPLVGGGIFSGGDIELLAGSLLGHLVYGASMGWIYGEPASAG
jgi:uncharacterized membrane protein YagU involved in acid resistance